MKNVIYTKFSNDRLEKFQIKTLIIKNEQNERCVEKHAATTEAKEHLINIVHKGMALEQTFTDTIFKINKPVVHAEYLSFQYIDGDTLEQKLKNEYVNGNEDIFYSLMDEYCFNVRKLAKKKFILTPEFVEVFGERNFNDELNSCDVTDIDLIFSNIIINDGWNVLDYEWSFDFPIPVDYIIYRALFNTNELYSLNLFNDYGISDELLIEFKAMEENFRRYVGYKNTMKNYQNINKRDSLETILALPTQDEYDEIKYRKDEMVQHGENLEHALKCAKNDIQMLQNQHKKDLQDLKTYHQKDLDEYENILTTAKNDIAMLQNRHQLDLQELQEYHQKDIAELKYYHQLEIQELTQLYDKKEKEWHNKKIEFEQTMSNLNNKYTVLERENIELKQQYEELLKQYDEMNNSVSWKITKPLRICSNLFERENGE